MATFNFTTQLIHIQLRKKIFDDKVELGEWIIPAKVTHEKCHYHVLLSVKTTCHSVALCTRWQ